MPHSMFSKRNSVVCQFILGVLIPNLFEFCLVTLHGDILFECLSYYDRISVSKLTDVYGFRGLIVLGVLSWRVRSQRLDS